jgi:hypothetical protein
MFENLYRRAVMFVAGPNSFWRVYAMFVCVVVAMMALSGIPQMFWHLRSIAAAPVPASGKVDRVDCPNHGHVYFSFQADGVSYGGTNPLIEGINCPDVKVGSPLAIYYERGAPQNNYAFYPPEADVSRVQQLLMIGSLFILLFVVLGPLFLAWIWTVFTRWTGDRPAQA